MDRDIKIGVIEGFFGKPWGWPARLSGVDFLRECGYRFYIYAPKADPFLRRRWRERMPTETMQHLSQLCSRCRDRDIAFGIGLTPFEIYLDYDASAKDALRSKVTELNDIGAKMLCILFDDMRGDVDGLAHLQATVICDVAAWSSAQHLIVCPTYYSYDPRLAREFGPAPKTYVRDLGRLLDSSIDFFWTGEKVISDGYSARHLMEVAADMRRKPFIWDNHISNDSRIRANHLFLDPSTVGWELPADLVSGLAINPMNQAYLSRIALCRYQHLLADSAHHGPSWPDHCNRLGDSSIAKRLAADEQLLQIVGLNQLDAGTRRRLQRSYGSDPSNPYAQEIAAWLNGQYAFDPECLTT